ncbi:2-polyprenyl-6-methoxyphenol hydroxylase-like FAD-dependent oxidoreductase [Saccharothrix coeruleofusca]|uniref:FAD-dependent monooxygenase n=1 Tax=Saccharothrix coeruleofusca TaxID=33919 RepID=UPI001AE65C93|nr:FAD-dependent monooxygenase [Saccharothrix coeruleofusca]MBP2336187.1 2-polyprenyl-6-methoxyphenol hydroxylase-like FAD-dependent oxidoreductase [Saccharothrix coeruleofusca]
MIDTRPVLIVGAGPTGLTAAVELSRMGVPVRVVDRAPGPATTSRALAVHARTLELLAPRGVGDELLALGNRVRATTLHGRGGRLASMRLDMVPSHYNYILMVPQSETERLLRERLAHQGGHVEQGVEMVDLAQPPDGGVHAVLRHPDGREEAVEAAFLISAEGAHSTARRILNLPFAGRALAQGFALADLRVDADLPEDELSIFLAPDGFAAAFPMGGHRFRLMAADPADRDKDAPPPSLAEVQAIYDHVSPVPATLRDLNWSSHFRVNSRHLSTLRVGRVFLGGDAAHVHSPAGGQGMNAGIQDMVNLCWKLAAVLHGRATPALLDTYQAERLPVIAALVRATERTTQASTSRSPLLYQVLAHLLPLTLGREAVQRKATRTLSQLAVHHRRGPLASDSRLGPLRAGDRVPDLMLEGGSRLYEVLDLNGPTLFAVAPHGTAPVWWEALRRWQGAVTERRFFVHADQLDADKEVADALRDRGGLLLVRPDGHLAAAAPITDPTAIAEWLTRWFTPRPPSTTTAVVPATSGVASGEPDA